MLQFIQTPTMSDENLAMTWQVQWQASRTVLHVIPWETRSAQYSVALFVASETTNTWQGCCETVTQCCATPCTEPAASIFRQRNKKRSQCLPPLLSVLQPPPLHSFFGFTHQSPATDPLTHLFHPRLSPLLSLILPFHHLLHPLWLRLTHCCDSADPPPNTHRDRWVHLTCKHRNMHKHTHILALPSSPPLIFTLSAWGESGILEHIKHRDVMLQLHRSKQINMC